MRRVLIVGPNSYIAKCFVTRYRGDEFVFSFLSVRSDSWEKYDFSNIDHVVYFSSIVHQPHELSESLYYKVNVDIPYKLAKRAYENGVCHFVYISSVAVWGIGPLFGCRNVINSDTPYAPCTLYGKSKLQAEQRLLELMDGSDLKVAVVRLPNVYGDDCPGSFFLNLIRLSKLCVFPSYKEDLPFSLVSVENVARALKNIICSTFAGICVPQDTNLISIQKRIYLMNKNEGGRQFQLSCFSPIMDCIYSLFPNKYMNNLWGGFYVDPSAFYNPVES